MTTSATPAAAAPPQRYKRSIKNYLIDSRFQLKYTGMIIAVALVISGILGAVLWTTSGKLVDQSQKVVDESKKVSEVVKMNIKDDPVYSDNPELAASFAGASSDSDKKIAEQEEALIQQQRTMLGALVGGLGLMVVLIGLLGIYFTHKVAGPIYMMKGLLRQVGEGKLTFNRRPRKGDELQSFFSTFQDMVEKLKERQRKECELLEAAIERAKKDGASDEAIAEIVTVRDEMRAALDK